MKNIRLGEQGQVTPPGPSRQDGLVMGITLEYLARRIESANGDSSNLISAASKLVPDAEGSEKDRAQLAVDRVLRPLALEALGTSLERNGVNGHSGNGVATDSKGGVEEQVHPERS